MSGCTMHFVALQLRNFHFLASENIIRHIRHATHHSGIFSFTIGMTNNQKWENSAESKRVGMHENVKCVFKILLSSSTDLSIFTRHATFPVSNDEAARTNIFQCIPSLTS